MGLDHEAADAKRESLKTAAALAKAASPGLDDARLDAILNIFAQVTPPEEPRLVIGLITVASFHSATARSQKPGNILLNWRKLIDIVPDIALAGVGAATLPINPVWTLPLAALYVWNKVWRGATEEFSNAEATTILALWKSRNAQNRISEAEGFRKTNQLRTAVELPPLSQLEFSQCIDHLVKLDCIELEDGIIWLREWIRVKYEA